MESVSRMPFFWGAATAAHQVEGDNKKNDWWAFEQAGRVKESSGKACDQFNRYKEDFRLISELGHTAHRFSVEWSRIEPEEGQWNERTLKHYEKVAAELRSKNIEPIVTLHHFTNPQWFAEQGGWTHDKAPFYFERFTRRVAHALGGQVRFWMTINEPVVYLYHSYCTGLWPPGEKNFSMALKVFRNLLKGHAAAYRVIHEHYEREVGSPVWVSIAKHMGAFTPCNPGSWQDRLATWLRDWFFNHLFLQALTTGFLFFPGIFCEFLSARSTLDYIGLNYYTRHFVTARGKGPTPFGADCGEKHHHGQSTRPEDYNVMGWELHPEGLYKCLKSLKRYRLPVMVSENGICGRDDAQRERYIREHLEAFQKAGREGVELWGYLYWSLLDNFEWAEGFGPRFGIIEVDYATQQRKIRDSAHVLGDICRKISQERLLS